jgi:hypothetical protein
MIATMMSEVVVLDGSCACADDAVLDGRAVRARLRDAE